MTASLAVQLGAAPATDPAGVVARLASIGYEGVEPVLTTGTPAALLDWAKSMGAGDLPSVDVRALKRALDAHGMQAQSTHTQLPEGEYTDAILDEHELLGAKILVVSVLSDPELAAVETFDDLDRIKRIAERFNVAADRARSRGMRVGYHNHFWEFGTDFDGRCGLEVFFDLCEPDVVAEVDVYWARAGGRDPVEMVKALGDRVQLLHLGDGDGQQGTPLGKGTVDLSGALAAASSARVHIVELEGVEGQQIWPALEESQRYVADRRTT